MDFNYFQHIISKLKTSPLGGLDAQFELAPKIRLRFSEDKIDALAPKKAAVTALFYPNSKNETCFFINIKSGI